MSARRSGLTEIIPVGTYKMFSWKNEKNILIFWLEKKKNEPGHCISYDCLWPSEDSDQSACTDILSRTSVISLKASLRKHAYSNMLKILPPKTENFQIKNSDIFIFLLKT